MAVILVNNNHYFLKCSEALVVNFRGGHDKA